MNAASGVGVAVWESVWACAHDRGERERERASAGESVVSESVVSVAGWGGGGG